MNISYNWLNDLIDFELSPEELGRKLTEVGLAVEGINMHGDDFVLDVDLTSNRPDCLSHLGLAREISVFGGADLRPRSRKSEIPLTRVLAGDIVRVEDIDLCPHFTARIIKNVAIGPSPEWLVDRLEAIGERSINNVADITNFVMHEIGQPMHSFDLDKLAGKRIIVRRAKNNESIRTLDEADRRLDDTTLAICDAEKPVAIAGIMGGLDSRITDSTANVLLEVAYFDRGNIRATSRKLNLATEASYRFERGVDIDALIGASDRAADLICELAGGELGDLIDIYSSKIPSVEIEAPDIPAAVQRLTGLEVLQPECLRILTALGMGKKPDEEIYVAPTWRHDLAIEEDLVEEVARHTGFANIAEKLPPAFGAGEYQANEVSERRLRQTLIDLGFDEAITYSFIDSGFDDDFETVPGLIDPAAGEKFVTLFDSVIEGAVRMRPTILPGLLDSIRLNLNHQRRDIKLFEIGKVFAVTSGNETMPKEQEVLAMVLTGGEITGNRADAPRELDFYDVKGAVEAALSALGITEASFAAAEVKHLRPGQGAEVRVANTPIGYLGRLDDDIASQYKFKQPVFVGEIDLGTAFEMPRSSVVYRPLSKFPAVVRDVSLTGKRTVTYANIRDAARDKKVEICQDIKFVDLFEGKGISDDERSITIRIEYRSDERTLVEEEVEAAHEQILTHITQKLGIKQRV